MSSSSRNNHFSTQRRPPRMLKDFLIDDSNSYSSSGFKSFPRILEDHHHHHDLLNATNINASSSSSSSSLLRSRSKAAASTTISAFLAIINTVKRIQFNVVKSKKNSNKEIITNNNNDIKLTVRVKDIIRWKSFCDLVVDEKAHLYSDDLASSSPDDHHYTTTTTTTGSPNSSSTPCSTSNGSSWCESDFTSEYLQSPSPHHSGNFEGYEGNNAHVGAKCSPCVGSKSMKATTESAVDTAAGPKELKCEEKEQRSPVSVLALELDEDENEDEDEHSASYFDQTLTNMENKKQKLVQKIRCLESLAKLLDPINLDTWTSMEEKESVYGDDDEDDEEEEEEEINEVEEKAKLLLNHAKAATSSVWWGCKDSIVFEQLLMDFFIDEVSSKRNESKINGVDDDDRELIRQANAWIKGEHNGTFIIDGAACVRDMDKKMGSWRKFEGEQEEISLQIEKTLLNLLLDELLVDL